MATLSLPVSIHDAPESQEPQDIFDRSRPTDGFGRAITDLRVSVTDRCNFKCVYCRTGNEGALHVPNSPSKIISVGCASSSLSASKRSVSPVVNLSSATAS